jgi:hypothetical protein
MSDNTRASGESRLTRELISQRTSCVDGSCGLTLVGWLLKAASCRRRCRTIENVWWSQTGSNRRPPACKAGALPAELWPLQKTEHGPIKEEVRRLSSEFGRVGLPSRSSRAAWSAFALRATARQPSLRCASEGWWAWEDLNFRPHAYQARALTN